MTESQDGCSEVPEIGSPAHGTEERSDTVCSDFRIGCFVLHVLSVDEQGRRGAEDQDCTCGMYMYIYAVEYLVVVVYNKCIAVNLL